MGTLSAPPAPAPPGPPAPVPTARGCTAPAHATPGHASARASRKRRGRSSSIHRDGASRTRRRRWSLAAALAAAALLTVPAEAPRAEGAASVSRPTAATATDADAGPGYGESYWGVIPAPADSVRAVFLPRPAPVWATLIDVPYEIIGFPLRMVVGGLRESIIFLDEQRVIYHVNRLLSPRELPYGVMLSVSAGGLAGVGGGATLVHDAFLGADNRFRLGFKLANNGNARVILGTHFNVDHPDELQIGAGYRVQRNARFFGVGPEAREADESFYTQELTWAGATYLRHLHDAFAIELAALFTAVGTRAPGEDGDPALASVFDDARPVGYGDRSDGMMVGLTLQSDTTDRTGTPEGGALLRAGTTYFTATDGSGLDYWSSRGEAQLFVPLWFSARALALRAFYTRIDPTDDGALSAVPFQRLMTNDDPDLMRGYRDFRWRDRGMVLLTAEYRWPVWAAGGDGDFDVHLYLFTDVGQVFGEHDEIALRHVTESFGGGLRAASWGGFVGRVEVGVSDEETVVRLRADQTFQFQKGGLYHGRNPVPAR